MHDSLAIPACFSASERQTDEPATITRSGQSVFMSIYQTKLASQCCLITITWCKNLLLHGLSISVEATNGDDKHYQCKIELKPWYFWRKQGCKQFEVAGKAVDVVWDLKAAKFNGETEPQSDYYVAIVSEGEVVLLLGDLKKDAYRKTRCRPSLIEPILISRKEHVFGKKRFTTRVKFQEKQKKFHEISIECNNISSTTCNCNESSKLGGFDPQLEIKVDGKLGVQVNHLQWKFRGNESIDVSKTKVEIYWDLHDWLFGSGPRHGLFIFKPVSSSSSSSSSSSTSTMPVLIDQEMPYFAQVEEDNAGGSSNFCLFLYTWKGE